MPDPADTTRSRALWHAYYSEKRIVHQWLQVELLQPLKVATVLEIGPYLGLVTAMLTNAGYQVTTLDIEGEAPRDGAVRHVRADVRRLDPSVLRGFDAILCCETLEHLPFAEIPGVLAALNATGAPYLVLSVPYEGPQAGASLYLNPHQAPRLKFFRKLHFLRRFPPPRSTLRSGSSAAAAAEDGSEAWESHRWEIGYLDYPLRKLIRVVEAAGYRIVRREFTSGTRAVFLVCERREPHPRA